MTREEKTEALRDWHWRMKACSEALAEFMSLTGSHPESRLMLAVQHVMIMATEHTAKLFGCSSEWLDYWWSEDAFGERPMKAGLVGEDMREIRTVDELAAFLIEVSE